MRLVALHGGHFAKVDDEDFESLSAFKWHASDYGYAVRTDYSTGKMRIISMHRQLMGYPVGLDVDHKDGDPLNNQRANLRVCTRSQNLMNQHKKRGHTSRFKGVYWLKANRKWRAKIRLGGKAVCLGLYSEERAAAMAYDNAALLHFGEFACINFPLTA